MTKPYSQDEIDSKYDSMRFDAEMCQQEIARTCSALTICETKKALLRRAHRLKKMGVKLNDHQKIIIEDGFDVSFYDGRCNQLRIKLAELRAENEAILLSIAEFKDKYDVRGLPSGLISVNGGYDWSSYSSRLKQQILDHASIEGYVIGSTTGIDSTLARTTGLVRSIAKDKRYRCITQQHIPDPDTIYIENDHVRIYASPFWDLEDEIKDNTKHLQIDVYIKDKRKYLTTSVEVDWSYNLDKDLDKWVTICKSVIATIFIREVDPMEEQ